jgi:predicted ferric reductase
MRENSLRTIYGVLLVLLYAVLAILPLGLAWLFYPSSDDPRVTDLGLAAGLLGFSMLSMQVAMGSRIHLLDRVFGLDAVMLFHRGMGIFATILLICHPFLLAAGTRSLKLFGLHTGWQVNMGKAALLVLVLSLAFTLWFPKLKVDYNTWRLYHKLMFVVVLLAFIHSVLIGPDLQNRFMATYWTALFTIALLLFLWQNVGIPTFAAKRTAISSITQETHDTFTIELKALSGKLFDYKPGQFMFLTPAISRLPGEEHPFTISSPPNGQSITATIKKSGDFTNRIESLKAGDEVYIQAPFGLFSIAFDSSTDLVFIAGGVGITPIRSMIEWMHNKGDGRTATLIYANKTEGDIIFRKELESFRNLKVHHVVSRPEPGWNGMKGHIGTDIIMACAADQLATADFYVCGPGPMMDHTIGALRQLNVPWNRIHMERFTL